MQNHIYPNQFTAPNIHSMQTSMKN